MAPAPAPAAGSEDGRTDGYSSKGWNNQGAPSFFFDPAKHQQTSSLAPFCVRNSIGIQPVAPPTPNVQENKGERLVKGQSLEALKENERGKI